MEEIREINYQQECVELLEVITKSFLTVANELNLTMENAPSNPAFLTIEKLNESAGQLEFFVCLSDGKITGCAGIQAAKIPETYYIERLAVLPEFRHKQIGKKLLDRCIEEIGNRNASKASIGIIDENTKLKDWYIRYGFSETGKRKFDHLPFTVCFMDFVLPHKD